MKARDLQNKKDEILICKDRGMHEYIAYKWDATKYERWITHLLCTRCFKVINAGEAVNTINQAPE